MMPKFWVVFIRDKTGTKWEAVTAMDDFASAQSTANSLMKIVERSTMVCRGMTVPEAKKPERSTEGYCRGCDLFISLDEFHAKGQCPYCGSHTVETR